MDLNALVSGSVAAGNPMAYVFVWLAGVITGFTPCIMPMVPIIMGIIGAQTPGAGEPVSKMRGFTISLSYVLGLSVTFTALGMIASLTGKIFGSVQSSPWAQIFMGNVILFMAMWFMDIITLPAPVLFQGQVKGKGILPGFLFGLASGIVAAPCTAAILAIILAYVGTQHNVIFGGTLLFAYALGLGVVLILAGTFTGVLRSLITSGELSMKVKKVFGILLFLVSQYFFIQAGKLF